MTQLRTVHVICAVVILAWGAVAEADPNEKVQTMKDREAIEYTLKQYEAALNTSNVDAALALYAEDGVFMPSEAPTSVGFDQVRGAYQHVFETIKLDISFSIDEIELDGGYAFARTVSRGKVTILSEGVTLPEENRELFILKKEGDDWKIARYMFNKMSQPAGH
jgi:uncharacterized protein (TIGR02246 family)